ncbi:MAG: alpha/beta hydrolase [Acidobacteriota bacterium]|nr:alpha/beta hydrolase [Acidobacteriota bacterium]
MPSWQVRLFSTFSWLLIKRGASKRALKVVSEEEGARLVRKLFEPPDFLRPKPPGGVHVSPINDARVRGEWLESGTTERTVYYLHGGGYVACSPKTHRGFTANLSLAANAKVLSLDYRLAPENKFPAALEDAVAGYRLLLEKGENPKKIVIGGDSAGGGLAAATLIALRERGLPMPAGAFLLSPWTDLAATGETLVTNDATDPMLSGTMVHQLAALYYGDASPTDPLVSPLYGDFRGFPPLRIYASNTEILLDDARRLAERAKQQGVTVDLRIWNKLPHVWPIFVAFGIPESKAALGEIAEFIRERTSQTQTKQAAA